MHPPDNRYLAAQGHLNQGHAHHHGVADRDAFLRSNTGNLARLAAFVSTGSDVVVVSVFNQGFAEIAANWYYAARRFGGIKEVLLAVFDRESLHTCLAMGFVCFDATTLPLFTLTAMGHKPEVAEFGGSQYNKVRVRTAEHELSRFQHASKGTSIQHRHKLQGLCSCWWSLAFHRTSLHAGGGAPPPITLGYVSRHYLSKSLKCGLNLVLNPVLHMIGAADMDQASYHTGGPQPQLRCAFQACIVHRNLAPI